MSQPANTSLGRKFLKTVGIILGSILGFILIASLLLLTFLEPVVGRFLKDKVTENTDGLYSLDFNDLQLNLLAGKLTLKQMTLHPDTAMYREQRETGAATPLLFRIEAPQLQISRINIIEAILYNRINIGTVTAEKPNVNFIEDNPIEKERTTEIDNKGSLPEFLDNLQINNIDIQDATLRYLTFGQLNHPQHELQQVNLLLRDFKILPRDQQALSRRLHADDVQLTIRNYAYQAPDSVYQLQIDLLSYSSKEGTLLAEGIALLSDHQVNSTLSPRKAKPNLYNIKVPALQISGLGLLDAYRTKQLALKEVLLEKPEIDVLQNKNASAKAAPDFAEVYQEIADYLTAVKIGELRLTDGKIRVNEKIEELIKVHELNGTEIALQEVILDSTTLFSPGDMLFAEGLHFSAENYTYQHPLSPHTIKTGKMELSTQSNYFYVDALQVVGDKEKNDRLKQSGNAKPLVFNLNASGLRFHDINLKQALKTATLHIGTIDVLQPAIEILSDKSVRKADTEAILHDVYTSVSDVIKNLVVENISLQDASFTHLAGARHVRRIQELKHVTLKATGLRIDSAFIFSPSAEGFPVEEAVLTAHDYTFRTPDKLYTFTLERLHYSTRLQALTARSVALLSSKEVQKRLKSNDASNRNLYDIKANRFSVTGLDLFKAIDTGELFMDQVIVGNPDFAMLRERSIPEPPQEQQQQDALEDLFSIVNPIRIKALRLEDGTFTYRDKRGDVVRKQLLEHASATVLGLYLSSAMPGAGEDYLPMQEMTLTAGDYMYRSPDGIYTITLDSLHYSTREQELTATRLDILSDKETNAFLKRNNSEKANRTLFDISAEKFHVSGLDLIRAYETGRFAMSEMLLTSPEVILLQDRTIPPRNQDAEAKEVSTKNSEALEQIAEVVETFRVDQLRVNDGNVKINILQDSVLTSQSVAHVSVAIDRLRTTSLENKDPLEMFQADEIGVVVRDYVYLLPDSLYKLQVGELRTSLQEQSLQITDLRLLPLYSKDEFVSRLTYEEDRFNIQIPHISMQDVHLNALFDNQNFIIGKALVKKPVLEIYRDKRIPENPDRSPPTLQEMLRKVDYYIQVDTIAVEGGSLTYAEVAPNGVKPGVLTLASTDLEAYNITNDPALISQDSVATVHASALLMGESELRIRFQFHLNHPENLYTYKGTLKPMDFTALNPLFKNLIFVSIEDGQIEKASFSVKATEHTAVGEMHLYYKDFGILIIDKEDPENPGFVRTAGSWLLNKLVIKSDNPAGNRDLRKGAIEVERDYQKSVFNHVSKAMINGITSSLMTPFVERITEKFIEF